MPPRSPRQGIAIGTVEGGEELPAADRTQHDEVERGGNGEVEVHDVLLPVLTNVSPDTAVVGTVLTLTGDHFTADAVVWIGDVAAPIVP